MCTLPLCPIDFSDSQFRGGGEDSRRQAEECKEEVGRKWGRSKKSKPAGIFFSYETLDKTSNATLSFKPCVFYLHSTSQQDMALHSFRLWEKHVVVLIKWPEPRFDKSTRFVSCVTQKKTLGNISIKYITGRRLWNLWKSHWTTPPHPTPLSFFKGWRMRSRFKEMVRPCRMETGMTCQTVKSLQSFANLKHLNCWVTLSLACIFFSDFFEKHLKVMTQKYMIENSIMNCVSGRRYPVTWLTALTLVLFLYFFWHSAATSKSWSCGFDPGFGTFLCRVYMFSRHQLASVLYRSSSFLSQSKNKHVRWLWNTNGPQVWM